MDLSKDCHQQKLSNLPKITQLKSHTEITQFQWLWCMGLVGLKHVRTSWIRDRTPVSRIIRWILYH